MNAPEGHGPRAARAAVEGLRTFWSVLPFALFAAFPMACFQAFNAGPDSDGSMVPNVMDLAKALGALAGLAASAVTGAITLCRGLNGVDPGEFRWTTKNRVFVIAVLAREPPTDGPPPPFDVRDAPDPPEKAA